MKWNKDTEKYIATIKKQMESLGVLEEADIENLNLLGDAHHLYIKAMNDLEEKGLTCTDQKGRMVANPAFSIVRSQQSIMLGLFKELSISTRQRRLLTRDAMVSEEDPMDVFLDKMNLMN